MLDVLKTYEMKWFSLGFSFHVFSELDDIQLTFGCLFGNFGGTWNSLFLVFEGLGSRYEIR